MVNCNWSGGGGGGGGMSVQKTLKSGQEHLWGHRKKAQQREKI